jgi:hypothetical protein
MIVLTKGYYMSEGMKWEDYYAGHKLEGYSFKYVKINDNGTFLSKITALKDFDFIAYLKKFNTIEELQEKTDTNYGQYVIEDNIIKCDFIVLNKYPMHFELEIITPVLLRDKEDGMDYHFVPVEEEKLKGLPEL